MSLEPLLGISLKRRLCKFIFLWVWGADSNNNIVLAGWREMDLTCVSGHVYIIQLVKFVLSIAGGPALDLFNYSFLSSIEALFRDLVTM